MNRSNLLYSLVLICAGSLSVLAFSPFHYYFLIYIMLAILFAAWRYASAYQAAWRGLAFGLGFFGAGVSWIYVSIHSFGDLAWPFAVLITLGFVLVLCAFIVLPGYLLGRFWPQYHLSKLIFAYPALWAIAEWSRSWVFTGFPWLYVGESQVEGPLAGFAPIVGVFGVSWLTALLGSLLVVVCSPKIKRANRYYAVLVIILVLITGVGLKQIQWTSKVGDPLRVSLVQGDIPQSIKWDPRLVDLSLNRYQALTQMTWHSQLIIWPENAVPLPPDSAEFFLSEMAKQAKQHQASILLGIPVEKASGQYYNSLLAIGNSQGLYFKRHLVPFGEYIPLSRYFQGLLQFLAIPMTGFVQGNKHQPLITVNGIHLSPLICYEIAYPNLLRDVLPAAQLFVTVSDDAWFGHSNAAWQHLQIAQIQAVITGRPILFSTNDGVTAIVNERGHIQARAPRFISTNLSGTVQARRGTTPWIIFGDAPIIVLAFVILALSLLLSRKKTGGD